MIEDLKPLFPENAHREPTIYTDWFAKPPVFGKVTECIQNRAEAGKQTGYTAFAEMASCPVGEDYNQFDFLHGQCFSFAWEFIRRNPGWNFGVFLRNTFFAPTVHAYAYRIEDGRHVFADARGVTDDYRKFFEEFSPSGQTAIFVDAEHPCGYIVKKKLDLSGLLEEQIEPLLANKDIFPRLDYKWWRQSEKESQGKAAAAAAIACMNLYYKGG